MTARYPLVIDANGRIAELPATDTLAGVTVAPATTAMREVEYFYIPARFDKAAASAGVVNYGSGAGSGLNDIQGGVWAVTGGVLIGTCDTTDATQYKRDQLVFPATGTPVGAAQTTVIDIATGGDASIYALLRRQSSSSYYACGVENATGRGFARIYARVANVEVASSLGTAADFVIGHTLRLTATVSGTTPTTVTCTVQDLDTGETISSATLSDSSVSLQSAAGGALAVTNGNAAAVAQSVNVKQFFTYDPNVAVRPRFVAFAIDSGQYGEQATAGQGTITGNTPAASALTALGSAWGGVNLGVQAMRLDQALVTVSDQLDLLHSGREQEWVVHLGGANDIGQAASTATVQIRIQSLCQAIRAKGWKVMLSTVLPVGAGETTWDALGVPFATFMAHRATVNTWMRANWTTFADALCDTDTDGRLANYSPTYFYTGDQVHLNDAGNAVLGALIGAKLKLAAAGDAPTTGYGPLTFGTEPMTFVSNGAGAPIMVAFNL